jgi:mRNA-degrading endonuclease YafQ of YafQ-DinJ toxin-antitoxin module
VLCKIPADASEHDLDVSLPQMRECHVQDAGTLATCAARKATVEDALRSCAKR